MKLVEKAFRFGRCFWTCKFEKETLSLNDNMLRDFLDRFWVVMGDIEKLIFSLHDQPSQDRIEVEVIEDEDKVGLYPVLCWGKGEDDEFGCYPEFDSVFKPYVGRKLWFQVEYVEG